MNAESCCLGSKAFLAHPSMGVPTPTGSHYLQYALFMAAVNGPRLLGSTVGSPLHRHSAILGACRVRPRNPKCCLTIRSTGHFAAVQVWASFHSRPNPAYRKMPVSSNVRPRMETEMNSANRLGQVASPSLGNAAMILVRDSSGRASRNRLGEGPRERGPFHHLSRPAFSMHSLATRLRARYAGVASGFFSNSGAARPNPALKRTRNGLALGPRGREVYLRPRGPSATPLRAA